ncbi:glycosyltransferase family 2 protein [Gemmata sp. JC717]|uniref:glycosyltransferase family 2 protein n=1 Tax=Gemmata algarum TaxID=2975278 RepID=UPI0021BA9B65|nr:glycosyltransferase family 2 protein [Gemmata algarum]MDY3554884.1 glycosyltransferase family 2 protein [Gemmata algarum]
MVGVVCDGSAIGGASVIPGPEIEVSVVMPCLNEARTVGVCVAKAVRALREMGVSGEVIVADNGSTDGSQQVAAAAGARVVPVARRGYGAALQGGISAAAGRYVVMGDADDSYDFSRIEPFVARLRAGDELVMGNRFRGGIQPGAMPWHHRYVGNPVLTGLLNLFFRAGVRDAHCGLRAFRRDAYARLDLVTTGMEFASEMVVKATLRGLRVGEVPVVLHPDGRDRPPHLRSFRDGWRHLRFLLLFCPLWLFLVPGLALLAAGGGLMVWLTPGPRPVGGVVLDVHTMLLGALCAILGHQTLWLGLYSKVFGHRLGLLPPDVLTRAVDGRVTVERGLVLGGLVFAAGVGTNLWLVARWWGVSLGELDAGRTLRVALWGLSGMVLGVQAAYGAFFLGLLDLWKPCPGADGGSLLYSERAAVHPFDAPDRTSDAPG